MAFQIEKKGNYFSEENELIPHLYKLADPLKGNPISMIRVLLYVGKKFPETTDVFILGTHYLKTQHVNWKMFVTGHI